jgi:hypothetical protein
MIYTKTLLAVAAALSISLPTAMARTNVDLELNFGPPAPIYEAVPPPRVGFVWAPGFWDYDHNRHVWRKGHWEHERHGQRWAGGRWVEHDGRWHLDRGHWERG